MPPEKKRALLALAVLAAFVAARTVLFSTDGGDPFRPASGDTPWVTVLSALCVLCLGLSVICFRRGVSPADLLGDEREQELLVPRPAIGFSLASLMAVYLGARAVAVLVLYGRD